MKDLTHENEWGRVMGPVTGVLKLLAAVLLAASPEAWVLYAIVFLWQFPHFMAIAWMCREDYARAGYLSSTFGRAEGSFCGLAELGCCAGSYPAEFDFDDRWRIRARLFGRGPHTWFDIFLLPCRLCLSQVECRGATSAHWFNFLSSHGVYSGDAW